MGIEGKFHKEKLRLKRNLFHKISHTWKFEQFGSNVTLTYSLISSKFKKAIKYEDTFHTQPSHLLSLNYVKM